jgi:hypothetical protein
MSPLGRRGHGPVAALLIAGACAAVGLSSCANIWGFDDLSGTRDSGSTGPRVTPVGVGADAGSGGDVGSPDVGPPDVGPPDVGPPDVGPPDVGQRDVPDSTSQDASRDATFDASSSGSPDGGQPDASGTPGRDAAGDAAVDAPRPPVAISIDFVGGGIPMAPTEIAGVFRAAQWNSAATAAGTVSALVLSDGTISAAAVTWDSGAVWQVPVTDAPGDTRMMTGYLDPRTTSTIVVSGLPASLTTTGYDVYVYASGDVPAGITRAASYGVGGPLQVVTQPALTPFSGTFTDAVNGGFGNYVVFRGVTGTTLTVTVRPVSGTGLRAPVNGIQIVTTGAGP